LNAILFYADLAVQKSSRKTIFSFVFNEVWDSISPILITMTSIGANVKRRNGHSSGELFKAWLKKKELSYTEFSRKSGFSYGTMLKWTRGAKPRLTAKSVLKRRFPDCPLVRI
jgi:DNA-binding transcriptional regulator YiaG